MITVMFPQRFYVFTLSFHLRILETSSCVRGCYKKKPCSHCNGRHASRMHTDPSEDKHEQPTPENASQQPARGREKEDQYRSQQGVNQKSLLSDESSGVERVCNLTTTEGPATTLPIVPV